MPYPVGHRKADNVVPLKGLLSVLGVEAEISHRRTPDDTHRRGLRWLVCEEVHLLVDGDRGRRGLRRPRRVCVIHHRLQIHRYRDVRREQRNSRFFQGPAPPNRHIPLTCVLITR